MSWMLSRRTFIIVVATFVALAVIAALALNAFLNPGISDAFARDATGLAEASRTPLVELKDGATFELRATLVRKQLGAATVKMLAYNGSVPGPTLKVPQGAEVLINVTNETDVPTTVHWHGIRLENPFDGAPHDPSDAIPIGGRFSYRVRFPDAGVYWYHPHQREDYAQELGLYGNIIVLPTDSMYWAPANREETLVLDDILIEDGQIAPFSRSGPTHAAMGRFGNVMLVNGETTYTLSAQQGEVVRFYLTNTANTRMFNVHVPGARMKLVGGDSGRYEREEFVEAVLLAPSERAVVDVLFERPGQFALEHRTPDQTYVLGHVSVGAELAQPSFASEFVTLRTSPELTEERARLAGDFDRAADKTLALVGEMPGMGHHDEAAGAHQGEGAGAHQETGPATPVVEWEDTMHAMNRGSTPATMFWKLIDRATGAENHAIDWRFAVGERVKLRIVNEVHQDHPMQHPFHIHGQRFLVLSRDGVPNPNLVWKDTVLVGTGETVEILVDMTNPGVWMAHCHIAEHLESGMMFSFRVDGRADTTLPHGSREGHQ